jgi:proteasome-associated ATPase
MLDKFIGETEHRIANMFAVSREYCKRTGKRSVIFIDEAEALLRRRGSGRSSDVEMTTVPTFLAEMDGLEKDHNPIFILSTNLPNALDEAITREGRIDLKIEVTRPNQTDAVEIFQIHLKKVKCCDDIDEMSQKGTDMIFSSACKDKVSGAMIQAVAQASARKALNRIINNKKSPKGVILTDLEESVKMINSSYAK